MPLATNLKNTPQVVCVLLWFYMALALCSETRGLDYFYFFL